MPGVLRTSNQVLPVLCPLDAGHADNVVPQGALVLRAEHEIVVRRVREFLAHGERISDILLDFGVQNARTTEDRQLVRHAAR